jgi:hypothetical protein
MHVSGVTIRPPLAVVSPDLEAEDLSAAAAEAAVAGSDKISVGVLGNFCSHGGPDHSVTLLTRGVMQHLNRTAFGVVMISVAGNMHEPRRHVGR